MMGNARHVGDMCATAYTTIPVRQWMTVPIALGIHEGSLNKTTKKRREDTKKDKRARICLGCDIKKEIT
jgi:hypothetical protein